jgi:hypothetical protein
MKPHHRWNGWLTCVLLVIGLGAAIACVALSYPAAAIVVTAMVLILGLRLVLFLIVMRK